MRFALVTTRPELQLLLQQVEDQFQQLERLYQLYRAHGGASYARDQPEPDEAEAIIRQHDPQGQYEDQHDVREPFDDQVYRLQKIIDKEIPTLLDWADQPVTRPEEARKFALMRNRIQDLETFTEIAHAWPDEFPRYQKLVLQPLRYIYKYWHRLERYQQVEREIPHGPYVLINEYGYGAGEYDGALQVLDQTTERLGQRGFDELAYGDVVLTTNKALGGDVVGRYNRFQDRVWLAVDYDPDQQSVPVLLHEFGHRLWAVLLTAEDKARYVEAFGWISQRQLQAWWELLEQVGFDLRQALRRIKDPRDQLELRKRFQSAMRKAARVQHVTVKELRTEMLDGYRAYVLTVRQEFLGFGDEYAEPKHDFTTLSVSSYGHTDPVEDFCETFMHYCMGWAIDPEIETRFLTALGVNN